jgi:hypothetical protein
MYRCGVEIYRCDVISKSKFVTSISDCYIKIGLRHRSQAGWDRNLAAISKIHRYGVDIFGGSIEILSIDELETNICPFEEAYVTDFGYLSLWLGVCNIVEIAAPLIRQRSHRRRIGNLKSASALIRAVLDQYVGAHYILNDTRLMLEGSPRFRLLDGQIGNGGIFEWVHFLKSNGRQWIQLDDRSDKNLNSWIKQRSSFIY